MLIFSIVGSLSSFSVSLVRFTVLKATKFLLLVFLISATFLGFLQAKAEKPLVKVGMYENAPKVFTSSAGQPSGIFPEILEIIAQQEGWELRYVPGTWAQGLERLATGEIDLMPDVARSVERERVFFFHHVSVLSSWSQVYANKKTDIHSILDLNYKRVAVLEGSVQQTTFKKLTAGFGLEIDLVAVPDYDTMFANVASGKVDAGITNRFYGLKHVMKADLKETAVLFEPVDLYFAASQKFSKLMLQNLDKRLLALKKDSSSLYYQIFRKWTSESIEFDLPLWIKITGLAVFVVLSLSMLGSVLLKHQVSLRTQDLRIVNQQMERRIEERTAELAQAVEKAQEADRIKSTFLATMSHELRTPLNSIIGFTGVILQGLAGPLNAEQQKQMTMVQSSSRHLLALINDVLDISKIEAGQLDLTLSTFDLGVSLQKMVKVIQPAAERKGLEVRIELDERVGLVTLDQRRTEQVILNLLSNAVKFTEKGHISIVCRLEDDCCVLVFSDTGIGIKPENLVHLFQPFYQENTGLARKHEGTGLGLSICKKIVSMMSGTIEVESCLGSAECVKKPETVFSPV